MPNGHGYSTWFVVPDEIAFAILNGLPIKPKLKLKTQDFLAGKIGDERKWIKQQFQKQSITAGLEV